MSDPNNDEPLDSTDDAFERSNRRSAIGVAIAIGALIAVIGGVPWALGFGPFGARMLASSELDVYVLNLSGGDVTIELSFASRATVTGGTLEPLRTLAGPFRLVSRSADGDVIDELDLEATRPVFYNVGGGRCFGVFDISEFYGGSSQNPQMSVVARLDDTTRIYVTEADTLVLPRRTAPEQGRGTVHWIEPVGCTLLDPEEEDFLIAQNRVRLEERRARREEALREAGQ